MPFSLSAAEIYAEQVLTNLERDLTQLQQIVKNGQVYMEKLRSESYGSSFESNYSKTTPKEKPGNYVIK